MGSFNMICAMSDTTIRYGDDVVMCLVRERNYYNSCSPDGMYEMISLPFMGKYNDYGMIEMDDSIHNDLAKTTFNLIQDRIYLEQYVHGSNGSKKELNNLLSIVNKEEGFSYDSFRSSRNPETVLEAVLEDVSRGDIFIKNNEPWISKEPTRIHTMFIHRKVYDYLISTGIDETYSDYDRHKELRFPKREEVSDDINDMMYKFAINDYLTNFFHSSYLFHSFFGITGNGLLIESLSEKLINGEDILKLSVVKLFMQLATMQRNMFILGKVFKPSSYGGQEFYKTEMLQFNQ